MSPARACRSANIEVDSWENLKRFSFQKIFSFENSDETK